MSDLPVVQCAGIDEVGRGSCAGPVLACAVAFKDPNAALICQLRDSKKTTQLWREKHFPFLCSICWIGIGAASVKEIDCLNIRQATFLAMHRALNKLDQQIVVHLIVVDGQDIPFDDYRISACVKADESVPEVSAASIIAKVVRDRMMSRLACRHPLYGWHKNAGYGTKEHKKAIVYAGLSPHHRQTKFIQ